MVKKALIILANGVEEMEAVITIDVLRRGAVGLTTLEHNVFKFIIITEFRLRLLLQD